MAYVLPNTPLNAGPCAPNLDIPVTAHTLIMPLMPQGLSTTPFWGAFKARVHGHHDSFC